MIRTEIIAVAIVGLFACGASVAAPIYSVTFSDAVTAGNDANDMVGPYWWITPGADDYDLDLYERPTLQTYESIGGEIASRGYYENLDIVQVKAGFDANYMYIGMELYGHNYLNGTVNDEGLKYRYQVRLGNNSEPGKAASAGGLLLEAQDPSSKDGNFSGEKAFGHLDTDDDVGGTSVAEPNEGGGSGYDTQVIADGKDSNDNIVLRTRIDPNNENIIEFEFDYKAFGYTEDDLLNLGYLAFSTDKGMNGISNFLWNDNWNEAEAGTPYAVGTLQNIYEVDSLTGGPIPEPAAMVLLGLGALALLRKRRA